MLVDLEEKPWLYTAEERDLLRQAKWQNICFDKNGKSYRGTVLWETKEEAAAALLEHERDIKNNLIAGLNTLDGILEVSQYSWGMQLPIL